MALNTTQRIRSIGRSAARDAHIRERLQHWKVTMRTRGESCLLCAPSWLMVAA